MKQKHKIAHMKSAFNYAECSSAVRLKVGALVVKGDHPISIGYNGTAPGDDNGCEDKVYMDCDYGAWMDPDDVLTNYPHEEDGKRYKLVTKPTVIHAERNALDKITLSTESAQGAVMFVTHAPCLPCAISMVNVKIKAVYYSIDYRDTSGIEYLRAHNVYVEKIDV